MSNQIGKIKPKKVKLLIREDGSRELVELEEVPELAGLNFPKRIPAPKPKGNGPSAELESSKKPKLTK